MADRPSQRGGDRGARGGYRGGRGGRGGAAGAGDRGGAGGAGAQEKERPKKENILDLGKYIDKRITVKFNGGRESKQAPPQERRPTGVRRGIGKHWRRG